MKIYHYLCPGCYSVGKFGVDDELINMAVTDFAINCRICGIATQLDHYHYSEEDQNLPTPGGSTFTTYSILLWEFVTGTDYYDFIDSLDGAGLNSITKCIQHNLGRSQFRGKSPLQVVKEVVKLSVSDLILLLDDDDYPEVTLTFILDLLPKFKLTLVQRS